LFDEITPELINQEFSFSATPSETEIMDKLKAKTKAKITLFKGNTRSTLQENLKNLPNMDLIYIDGGHSIETIKNDWKWASQLMKPSSAVFFDDFFPEIPSVGCKFILGEIDKTKYDAEVLPETDTYSKEWGRLTTQLVRVQLKTSSWREVPDEEWNRHIASESRYWGTCQNTLDNQLKQQCYVKYMGLNEYATPASGQRGQHLYGFDLKGKSILDVGGGPVSLLLRCYNFSRAVVVDPCNFPSWVVERYKLAGIEFINQKAEGVTFDQKFDEAWIYNCLQHVQDPVKVVNMAIASAHKIRVCEPRCEVGLGLAHPHNLTKENLDGLFHKVGTAESIPLTEVRGQVPTKLSYYGIFDYRKEEEPKEASLIVNTPAKSPDGKYRFHVLGLAHTKTNLDYVLCGYTQKVYKMCQMLIDLGHEVYHYGAEGSNPPCTENIQVITDAEQKRVYGDFDWHKYYWRYSADDEAHKIFNRNAAREINLRKQPRDMLLISNGAAQKATADAVNDVVAIESGIGYLGVFAKYKVFESYAWMHHIYGLRDAPHGSCDIKYYDCVIPNYYNPDDFEYSDTKDDYYLYVGRLIPRKGVHIAAQVVDKVGGKLIVVGQGDIKNLGLDSHNVEHVGTVGIKGRSDLMRKAKALFVPTIYLEPFGGVAIEANFCGTPVITTDFGAFTETVRHGVTGYRCKTMDDFVWAAKNVDKISPEDCRKHAEANYSMERVSKMYAEYFGKIQDLFSEGWYEEHPERSQLEWLRRY